MPCCASRVVSVAPIMAKVKPEEMPRNSAASWARSRYGRTASAQRVLIVDGQRRVVGKPLRLVDRFLLRRRRDARGRDLVVEAPADVLLPRLAAVRPPGVLLRLVVQAAEDVDETHLVEHARQPGALLGQEAGILLVGPPVLQVDLAVGDVPVAA